MSEKELLKWCLISPIITSAFIWLGHEIYYRWLFRDWPFKRRR